MLTWNLCGYGWVSGVFFKSATAALRNLKYSFGEICSSNFARLSCFSAFFEVDDASFATNTDAAAAILSLFSFAFCSAFLMRFNSLKIYKINITINNFI